MALESVTDLHVLFEKPAGKPPLGVTPSFESSSLLRNTLAWTCGICISLSTIVVILRMYTKLFIIRSRAWEDYALLLGWFGQIGFAIPFMILSNHGGGAHMWNLRMRDFFALLYWVNISAIVYAPTIFFIKLSILLQYLRIFVPTREGHMFMYVGVNLVIWGSFLFYLIHTTVFDIFECTPREKIWHPYVKGHCFNNDAGFRVSGMFNVISDFAILVLPMPSLWRLQVPLKNKVLAMAVFATGLLACIASILRTYYSWRVAESPDISYNVMLVGIWAWAEMAIGIIVSCLPVVPKFFRHFHPKVRKILSLPLGTGKASENRYITSNSQNPFSKKSGRSRIPDAVDESFDMTTRDKKRGTTIREYSVTSPSDSVFIPDARAATKREDLEMGRNEDDRINQQRQYANDCGRSNWNRESVGLVDT